MKKKRIALLLVVCILLSALSACKNAEKDSKETYRISFFDEKGNFYKAFDVAEGESIPYPGDLVKKDYIFAGWYTAPQYGSKFDFSQKATQNLALYANFQIDAASITNKISRDIMKSIVKIQCRSYNMFWDLFETESTGWSQGSGFCFEANNGCYYILTNCHVAMVEKGYDYLEIKIEDYKGKEYKGFLYHNSSKKGDAISAEYDLACIYFKADSSKTDVQPLSLKSYNPEVGEDVISLGAPKSQTNSITFGKIKRYSTITLDETPKYESNVTFPVIHHSAETDKGSSGGPLLNSECKVVGVNYAVSTGGGNDYALPIEKVHEFLTKYVYG